MQYNPNKHHLRSIRLRGYDYSKSGAYFITLCVQDHVCLFGHVSNGKMQLNELGQVVQDWWDKIPTHFSGVELDAFVVMPNHVHGIVILTENLGSGGPRPYEQTAIQKRTLGHVVAYFKYQSTKQIHEKRVTPIARIWQRDYFDRILRTELRLNRIRRYIAANPSRWKFDPENRIP